GGRAVAGGGGGGRWPAVVGPTGFFSRARAGGFPPAPPIPPQIRASVRERLEREGIAALYAELGERDAATARRLMPRDRARVTRALEGMLATGRSLTHRHAEGMKPALEAPAAVQPFLDVQRAEL